VLLLVALAAQASPPQARIQSTAIVRIERPVTAGREEWDRLPASQKRERLTRDEQGRPMLLRIVENP
jgi:hypothetical protein